MRPTRVSYWQFLKHSRLKNTTWRTASMNFSCSQTTITSNASWIWKTWAPGKSGGLKSCQDTTFGLIINKIKEMELLMLCLDISSGMLKIWRPSELRKPKSCTDCSLCWLGCLDWASWEWAFRGWNSKCCPPCTKSSFAGQSSYCCYASSGTPFEASYLTKIPTLRGLEI